MNGILSKLKTVRDYVLAGARAVCGAARDLSQELPAGTVRDAAGKVAGWCDALGLMPEPKPAPVVPVPAADVPRVPDAGVVPSLHEAVVRGAAGDYGDDWERYCFLAADPTRTDGEDAEMKGLAEQLAAAGWDLGLPPVARWPANDGRAQ